MPSGSPGLALMLLPILLGSSACLFVTRGAQAPSRTSPDSPAATAPSQGPPERTQDGASILRVAGAELRIELEGARDPEARARLVRWVEHAANMVSEYLGGFPVPDLTVHLDVGAGSTVGFGQHFDGRHIRVHVGQHADEATLMRDWVMVHEMLHAAFPSLEPQHRWMQEGLSTYLESILRVRAGVMSDAEMWDRWLRNMPYGLPQLGEGGLDDTPTWGRTYWGGALFWLFADARLLRETDGARGLYTIMRTLRARHVNARVHFSMEQVLALTDEATGSQVVRTLYEQQARSAGKIELTKLWRRLGVQRDARNEIVLDDAAPWSAVRHAMTRAPHGQSSSAAAQQ